MASSEELTTQQDPIDIASFPPPKKIAKFRQTTISFLYVCMVNTIYLFSFVETPRKFIIYNNKLLLLLLLIIIIILLLLLLIIIIIIYYLQ